MSNFIMDGNGNKYDIEELLQNKSQPIETKLTAKIIEDKITSYFKNAKVRCFEFPFGETILPNNYMIEVVDPSISISTSDYRRKIEELLNLNYYWKIFIYSNDDQRYVSPKNGMTEFDYEIEALKQESESSHFNLTEARNAIINENLDKEGVKYDNNKPPLNLISNYALEELAKVLDFGAKKYAPWNWAKGISYSRVIAAAKRHIAAWENRQDLDEESKANHLAAAMCNLMFLLDYEARNLKELDDRRPVETLKK